MKRVKNFLDNKLNIIWNKGGTELRGWYWLDGEKVLKVYIPHQHGSGKGDSLTYSVVDNIKNNLKLSDDDFENLYECTMKGKDYEEKLRDLKALNII